MGKLNCLKNKRGEGTYIYLCVLILFITTLMSLLITYMSLTAQITSQKREIRARLDGYVSEYAAESYDAIKQGNRYDQYIDYAALKNGCLSAIGFSSSGRCNYSEGCTLTGATVTVLRGNGFGLTVRYTAVLPIRWNGRTFTSVSIPVTVSSYFKTK